jgi:polysaccharide biosynthesis transport protein
MANGGAPNTLSIFSLIDALRRRKLIVIVPAILLCVGFTIYAYQQVDRYRASVLLAAEHTTPPEYLKHVAAPALNIEDHLWIVQEALFSPPVLEEAARELQQYKNIQGKLPAEALDQIREGISIKLENEHTFQITFDTTDRYDAMNVTNKLAEVFVRRASANSAQKNQDAATVIDDQLNALKQRLEVQSQELHSYKQKAVNALPDHIDDNLREIHSLRDALEDRLSRISEEEARRTTIQNQLKELESKGVLDQAVVAEKSPDELKLDELRFKEKELAARYTPKHPELIQTRKSIEDMERALATQPARTARTEPSPTYLKYVELKAELDGIEQRINSYRRDQQRINSQMATFNQRVEVTPEHERVLEDLQRELEVGESQFHALLDKKLDASMAKDLAQSASGIAFAIVEPAALPVGPYGPQRERLILMGLIAGLGLGLALAFVLEQNDTTFGTLDDYQSFTNLPAIGVIPNVWGTEKAKKQSVNAPIVCWTDPESVAAEQYRVLALKLQQQCEAAQSKVVMITSAAGGEGKSMTAINLAVALAATAQGKVLLVDGDMRKPKVNEYLDLSVAPGKGFHTLLLRPDDDPEKYAHKMKGIDIIPSNVPSANPVAALASPKARAVFEKLREKYAFIVVDAPPILPIADSHILSGLVDKVLFVVRARQTPRELFQHALEGFDAANLLGAVLNDVDYQRSRYAYAYQYYKKVAA